MAHPLQGWKRVWLSIISAVFCWSHGRQDAGGGGVDTISQWSSSMYTQGGQELMATTFGGKLPSRPKDNPHSSGS